MSRNNKKDYTGPIIAIVTLISVAIIIILILVLGKLGVWRSANVEELQDPVGNTMVTEESRVNVYYEEAQDYVGSWVDMYDQKTRMEISTIDGIDFKIEITRVRASLESVDWTFDARYSSDEDGLRYSTNGSGLIWMDEEGLVYWANEVSEEGTECVFCQASQLREKDSHIVSFAELNEELLFNLPDGTYAVSFDKGDLTEVEGRQEIAFVVYSYDYYNAQDILEMVEDNTIVFKGKDVNVSTLDWGDGEYELYVNGGYEAGGISLVPEENEAFYRTFAENELPDYFGVGIVQYPVSAECRFIDLWDYPTSPDTVDLNDPPKEYTVGAEDLPAAFELLGDGACTPDNTTITIKDGQIIQILRIWVP